MNTTPPLKVALLIHSSLEGAGQSAIYRALMGAQELRAAGDDVVVVFDGAASTAAAEMAQPGNPLHTLFADVLPLVRGVCHFCAKSYAVINTVQAAAVPLLKDDRGHASLRGLLLEGRQIITF
jgi:hypothetical protein